MTDEVSPTDTIWMYAPIEEKDSKLGQGFDDLETVKRHIDNIYNFAGTEPIIIKRETDDGELEEIQPYRPT